MTRYLGACALLSLLAVPALAQEREQATIDFTDPAQVVTAIFHAARSGDASALPELCPPEGGNDGDTRNICEMTTNHPEWDEFVSWFATGKLTGEATITDDRATVPFVFGPDGTSSEQMNLVRIDGRWYLSSF